MADNRDDDEIPPVNSSRLEEINRRTAHKTVHESESGRKAGEAYEEARMLTSVVNTNKEYGIDESKAVTNQIAKYKKGFRTYGERARSARSRRIGRGQSETLSAVARELGEQSVNGQIRELGQDYRIHRQAMGMTNESDEFLQERLDELGSRSQSRRRDAQDLISSGKYYDQSGRVTPAGSTAMENIYKDQHKDVLSMAAIHKTQSLRKKLGLDEQSRDIERGGLASSASNELFKAAVKSGQMTIGGQSANNMSTDTLEKEKLEASKQLAEVWKQMTENNPAKNMEKLREEFDKLSETVKVADAAIATKKEKDDKQRERIGHFVQGVQVAQQAWGAYKQGARADISGTAGVIDMQFAAKANAIQGANLSNRMWDMRQAAIGGDMTTLDSLTGGLTDRMGMAGENIFYQGKDLMKEKLEATKRDQEVLPQILNTVGKIGAGAAAGAPGGPIAVAVGGSLSLISGGIDTYSTMKSSMNEERILKANEQLGVDVNSMSLQAQTQEIDLDLQQRYVTGAMKQKLYDYGQGMRQASLAGGGSVGRRIANQFASDTGEAGGLLSKLENARISPEQFAQLTAQGAAQQGSVFNTNQVFSARNLERAGFGSMQENMARMSALGGAGSNNPQAAFGSVLEAAFSKSLDSSKALNMMVENTAAMVQSSAGTTFGMDTSRASASLIAGLVDPNAKNEAAAIASAIKTRQSLEEKTGSIGTSFTDQVGILQIAKASGLSTQSSMILKNMDTATVNTMQGELEEYMKMSPEQKKAALPGIREKLNELRLGEAITPNGEIRDPGALIKGFEAKRLSFLNQGAYAAQGLESTTGWKEFRAGKVSYEELTAPNSKYRDLNLALQRASGLSGDGQNYKEFVSSVQIGKDPNSVITAAGKQKADEAQSGAGGTKAQKELDKQATAQAAEFANQARLAAERMGGVTAAMGTITEQMNQLVKQLNSGTSAELQNAAIDASRIFGQGATTFSNAVDKFALTQGIKPTPASAKETNSKKTKPGQKGPEQ